MIDGAEWGRRPVPLRALPWCGTVERIGLTPADTFPSRAHQEATSRLDTISSLTHPSQRSTLPATRQITVPPARLILAILYDMINYIYLKEQLAIFPKRLRSLYRGGILRTGRMSLRTWPRGGSRCRYRGDPVTPTSEPSW